MFDRDRSGLAMMALVLVAALGATACARSTPAPAIEVAPQPLPPAPAAAAPAEAAYPDTTVCIVERDAATGLRMVRAKFNPSSGQILVADDGRYRPFADRYPSTGQEGYASDQGWFIGDEPIEFGGRRYVKAGVRRMIDPQLIEPAGSYNGIPLFVDPREASPPTYLYLPTEPGCVFQGYMGEREIRSVRG